MSHGSATNYDTEFLSFLNKLKADYSCASIEHQAQIRAAMEMLIGAARVWNDNHRNNNVLTKTTNNITDFKTR